MTKKIRYDAALREALRRLGNPYAKLSVLGDPDDAEADGLLAQAHDLRNQSSPDVRHLGVPKAVFLAECRRIFRQYIPPVENGRLRAHHRAFIVRNESRSPETRHRLLVQLRRYDLSDVPGMQARFNRERSELTEEKLRQVEQAVNGNEPQ
jgi:hypothetical protein